MSQQQACQMWNTSPNLPHELRVDMVTEGVKNHGFDYPITLVAVSTDRQVAVFRWENEAELNDGDLEDYLWAVYERELGFPLRLFLKCQDSAKPVLSAEKNKNDMVLASYRTIP